ncbi:hypothetical protein D3C74_91710 [compost metagenome]
MKPISASEKQLKFKLTDEQQQALKGLSHAYSLLWEVWSEEWEGEDNFGGELDSLGLLPIRSLDEAASELDSLVSAACSTFIYKIEVPLSSGTGMIEQHICNTCLNHGDYPIFHIYPNLHPVGPVENQKCSYCGRG